MKKDNNADIEEAFLGQNGNKLPNSNVYRTAAAILFVSLAVVIGVATNRPMANKRRQRPSAPADFSGQGARRSLELHIAPQDLSFDVQAFIDSKLQQGEKHIILPPGRHYVEPQHSNGKIHLLLNNLEDITIDGMDKAEIICTKTTRAISISNCRNLTLKGLVVDYDPLPFTQGKIIDISKDKLELTVSMIEGYPNADSIATKKVEIYDSETHELATTTYFDVTVDIINETNGKVIVRKKPFHASMSQEKVGDIVVFDSKNVAYPIPHAIFAKDCIDINVDNVKIYASNMFGILENDCSGSLYISSVVDRRLPSEDIKSRGFRRLRSANADAFHSKHADVGPSFTNVIARYNGDDGIAVNGHYHLISKHLNGPTNMIRVIGKNGEIPNLSEGDDVELVKYSGERVKNAKIVSFDPENNFDLVQEEKEFLEEQFFNGRAKLTKFATKAYIVILDRFVDLPTGSLIASMNRLGNGFKVSNCIIGPNRARGILAKASNGVVTGNTVKDTWLSGIMLAPEYSWLEAGSGNVLFISNNTITRAHDVAISVYARGGDGSIAPAGAHNGIMIKDNAIMDSSMPAIVATSTRNLFLFRNNITGANNALVPSWKRGDFGRQEDPARQIFLHNVET